MKHSFSELIRVMNPWTQSHFVMWLDIKVAEYKVYGKMVLDNKSVTTPEWLRNKNLGMEFETEAGQTSKDQQMEDNVFDTKDQQGHSSTSQHGKDSSTNGTRVGSGEVERPRREANVVDLSKYSDPPTYSSHTEESYLQKQSNSSVDRTSQGAVQSFSGRQLDSSHVSVDRSHVSHSDFARSSAHYGSGQKAHSLSHTSERDTNISSQRSRIDSHTGSDHQELSDKNMSTFTNPFSGAHLHMSNDDIVSNFTKLATGRNVMSETQTKSQTEQRGISSNIDLSTVKIEILDDDSDELNSTSESNIYDKSLSNSGKKSLPDFGRTFATGSRHSSSSSVPSSQITSQNIIGSEMSPQGHGHLPSMMTFGDFHNSLSHPVPVSMYMTTSPSTEQQVSAVPSGQDNTLESDDHGEESTQNSEQSWKHKKWQYIESLRGSSDNINPKVQSRIMQRTKVFPDPFPVERLKYGNKARDMINSGVITRPAKMQFLDTVFNEIVKYTGLYPTPTQKMDVAKAIVNTFPKLNVRSKDSHISPADSWFVVLNDKFRNERRGLNTQSYQSQQMRQRALVTVRRAQAHMYNIASLSRSSATGFSGVVKEQTIADENSENDDS